MRRLVFTLLLCGCGFLGEAPFTGQRVAAVAPWQDEGPLTICDGTLLLGAPASLPAGFCGAAPTRTCTNDGDCGSRERCLCGVCNLGYCDTNADCQSGFVCTASTHRCDRPCQKDSDCKEGESCAEGRNICRGGCNSDVDCQAGETCNLGQNECQSVACGSDADCAKSTCAVQRRPATLTHPAPLAIGDEVVMWVERDGKIVRARSQDGRAFALAGAVLDGKAPAVVGTSDSYLMLLESGGGIARSSSTDGVSWSAPTSVIPNASQPSLVQLADSSFAAFVVTGVNVSRSLSMDGASFGAPEVVLTPDQLVDPTLWRNVDAITSPYAQLAFDLNGTPFLRLWFAARGQESSPAYNFGQVQEVPANFSIGEASSTDGLAFTPYPFNPVFDRVVNFIEHPSELEPAIVEFHGEALLYYRRASADGSMADALAVARSPQQPR